MNDQHDHLDHVSRIQAEWSRERPDLDMQSHGLISRLLRLAGLQADQLALAYKQFGLSGGEFDVLAALRRAGEPFERAPGELAASTMVTGGAATKRVDRLEKAGLVTRRPSAKDLRYRVVALTHTGRELIDRAFTEHIRTSRRLLDDLTPEQATQLEALLTIWLSAAEPPLDAHENSNLSDVGGGS